MNDGNHSNKDERLLASLESIAASLRVLALCAQAQQPAHRVSALNDAEKAMVHARQFVRATAAFAERTRCDLVKAVEEVNQYRGL